MHTNSFHRLARAVCFAGMLLPALAVAETEPWVDSRIKIDGCLVWLDASRQNQAREAAQLAPLSANNPADYWLDGSGRRRHLMQPVVSARPTFRRNGAHSWFSFDGQDDFLGGNWWNDNLTDMTIIVVAAPRSNPGYFRALLSLNQIGRNDYQTGLNLDLGGKNSTDFGVLNAEGAGFGGEKNLLNAPLNFKRWNTFSLAVGRGPKGVKLFVNGLPQGTRDRADSQLRADEFRVGARHYDNSGSFPAAVSFFDGDMAEVLIFARVLPNAERERIEGYLAAKYAGIGEGPRTTPLVAVTNGPPVQMLVPGFEVAELPVTLNNVNNLRYRPDGQLYAVCYDGTVWLLRDTDGDGLEDRVTPFWTNRTVRAPIGAAITPPNYARGEGLFLPNIHKLTLVVDTNHDGRADEEIICASWSDTSDQSNVDALGCALDRDGNIFFGVGTASFTDGYQVRPTGQSRYSLTSIRGTIQKLSPDFKKLETVCTGTRFTVGMAFHRSGDLFVTDQEGATWLPNGNPLDELLHIQAGNHYGFPPRHPKHLPNVIDEPSVFDYAPQHQSTCGLCFNDPVNGGPTFGPASWAGDALIAGESRGKIYRTKLVKTAAGYVAQNHLIACTKELAIDVAVTPRGDLLLATHTGAPDWGSGPGGKGHLYRIRYSDTNAPQPVLAWSASPTEIKIAFDKSLPLSGLKELAKKARIAQGRHVAAGDRFEIIRPGYQVVRDQLAQPRYSVEILGTSISPDSRTLTLTTKPRETAVNCAVTLPLFGRATLPRNSAAEMDILADAHGLQASWRSADGKTNWSGWLPHADLVVAREFTAGSSEHEGLFKLLAQPGTLTLRGQLDLWEMLQPAIQPGAKLDYTRPQEQVSVVFADSPPPARARREQTLKRASGPDAWQPFSFIFPTGPTPELTANWSTSDDKRLRAFPLRRFLVPWTKPEGVPAATNSSIPEIAGGNWLRGSRIFSGSKVACAKCHTMRGEGGHVGPDLSNLPQRDYASVQRDISQPNAALNPDHIASIVDLQDGDSLVGLLTSETAAEINVVDVSAQPHRVPRANVKSIRPAALSLMPEGLWNALSADEQRDLMTFLLTNPLEPAPLEREGAPPPRKRSELAAFLPPSQNPDPRPRTPIDPKPETPLRIVLCDGPKDHGIGEHDYPLWKKRWSTLLALADGVTVETAHIWPSAAQFAKADVIVFFSSNPGWNAERAKELDAFLARGGGANYYHWAVEARGDAPEFAKRIGLASNSGKLKFRHGPIDLVFADHPLARGFAATHFTTQTFVDETYWQFIGNPADVNLLGSSMEEGELRPQLWTREVGKGRVFVSVPGHYNWTFDDPLYRVLVFRGICWSARQPLDRLSELATIGARIAD